MARRHTAHVSVHTDPLSKRLTTATPTEGDSRKPVPASPERGRALRAAGATVRHSACIPRRRHTPATPPSPLATGVAVREHGLALRARVVVGWSLLGFPLAAGDASSVPTASHHIPWCFALGKWGAKPTPPATRFFRVAEHARRARLAVAGPRATTLPVSPPRSWSSHPRSGPYISRRPGGRTPPDGFVPLDAPPA